MEIAILYLLIRGVGMQGSIVCITDKYSFFTKDKMYPILYGIPNNFETESAYYISDDNNFNFPTDIILEADDQFVLINRSILR